VFYHAYVPQSAEKRPAIYVRSSTNMRTTESQLEACRRTAEQLGFDVVNEFIGVHTVEAKPNKVAFVRVDYADGMTRTFRFARGDGVAL
jgi:DNA invertase Pin-like site-specific DNA recombinase